MSDLTLGAELRKNALLRFLSDEDLAALQPIHAVSLGRGDVLIHADERNHAVFFPVSGIISVIVMLEAGNGIEAGMIGREGAVGVTSALGTGQSPTDFLVQGQGSAFRVECEPFRKAVEASDGLRRMLDLYTDAFAAQSMQSLACLAYHPVEARLSRWLLMARDQMQSDHLPLTQEFLAEMLGVQRSTVALTAIQLQNAGLIRYRRGNIEILDAAGVDETSCECYASIKAHYERVFSALG